MIYFFFSLRFFLHMVYDKAKANGHNAGGWAAVTCLFYIGVFAVVSFLIGIVLGLGGWSERFLDDWRLMALLPMTIAVAATWFILRPIFRSKSSPVDSCGANRD